jgi:hypothetical protein
MLLMKEAVHKDHRERTQVDYREETRCSPRIIGEESSHGGQPIFKVTIKIDATICSCSSPLTRN